MLGQFFLGCRWILLHKASKFVGWVWILGLATVRHGMIRVPSVGLLSLCFLQNIQIVPSFLVMICSLIGIDEMPTVDLN